MTTIKFTDPFFAKAITDISVNHTLSFTPNQLFYLLDKRLSKKHFGGGYTGCYIFLAILLAILFSLFISPILGSSSILVGILLYNVIWISLLISQSKSKQVNNDTRKAITKDLQFVGVITLISGIIISLILNSFFVFVISVIAGMLSIYLGIKQRNLPRLPEEFVITQDQFQAWINRWQEINGSITKMLPLPDENTSTAEISPDVTAYSFDRLIVCDRANIAQFLIANNFHFENNCAILSVTGYPQSIFNTTMEMLQRNSDLKVYAFHDCSPKGMMLMHHLRTSPKWFANSNLTIVDIGLTPKQILSTKRGMFIRNSSESAQAAQQLSEEVRSLPGEELQWLQVGNFVELESFPPQKLIQILRQGIANTSNLDLADDTGYDSGVLIYGVDSFG
jgi:hypothetical protein